MLHKCCSAIAAVTATAAAATAAATAEAAAAAAAPAATAEGATAAAAAAAGAAAAAATAAAAIVLLSLLLLLPLLLPLPQLQMLPLVLLLLLVLQRLPPLRDYCFHFSCCCFATLLFRLFAVFFSVAALPRCQMPLVPRALTGGRWPLLGAVKIQCVYWGERQGCGHDVLKN